MTTKFFKYTRILIEKTIFIVLFLMLWEIAPKVGWINKAYFPPFSDVFDAFIKLAISGKLFIHMFASLNRIFWGLIPAAVIAIILGFIIGASDKVSKILKPIMEFFRNTPTIAILPVLIFVFGLSEVSKISVIFIEAFWPTLIATVDAVRNVDPVLIKAAKSMQVSKIGLFTKVIIPSSVPNIVTGFRLSATNSILILVVAEMLGGYKGLGLLVKTSGGKNMFAAIMTITLIGLILNFIIVNLENYLTRWKERV